MLVHLSDSWLRDLSAGDVLRVWLTECQLLLPLQQETRGEQHRNKGHTSFFVDTVRPLVWSHLPHLSSLPRVPEVVFEAHPNSVSLTLAYLVISAKTLLITVCLEILSFTSLCACIGGGGEWVQHAPQNSARANLCLHHIQAQSLKTQVHPSSLRRPDKKEAGGIGDPSSYGSWPTWAYLPARGAMGLTFTL